jgi:hypothetical protein
LRSEVAGWLNWSSTGKKMRVHDSSKQAQYLYLLDGDTANLSTLFEYREHISNPWLEEDRIRYYTHPDREVFQLDLISGETKGLGTAIPAP